MQEPSGRIRSRASVGTSVLAAMAVSGIALTTAFWVNHQSHSVRISPSVSVNASAFRQKSDSFLLREVNGVGETGVLVQLNGDLTAERARQLTRLEGKVYRDLPIIHAVALRVPRRNLTALADLEFVKRLSADSQVVKTDEFIVEGTAADKAFARFDVTGKGVGVAILDSGIDRHQDLKGEDGTRIIATKDFVDPTNTRPVDEAGHGTHIAGIIAGNGEKSTGSKFTRTFRGIAPEANLINVRVLDKEGNGSTSDAIAGLGWIVANKDRYNIRVVNVSLGHPVGESTATDPLALAAEAAWKSGLVVVTSAGNYGRYNAQPKAGDPNEGWGNNYGAIQSPANSPYVITVGATKPFDATANRYNAANRAGDKIATYSSRGPTVGELVLKPDIVAPGNRLISTRPDDGYLPQNFPNNEVYRSWYVKNATEGVRSKDYYTLSGTSMAAPVVAGAAALLLEKNPNLTPDTVKARLLVSADKWTNPDGTPDPFTYGAGYLNVAKALESRVRVSGYALSPNVTVRNDGTLAIAPAGAYWAKNSLWGSGITDMRNVWGTAAFRTSTVFADPGYLYANVGSLQGDIILWGQGTDPNPKGTLTTQGGIILWGQGTDPKISIILWGQGTDPVRPTIILWGQGTDPKIGPVVGGNIILWGQGTDPKVGGNIILWGPGTDDIRSNIILWGQGTDPKVGGNIILWGQGTDPRLAPLPVNNSIILWGQGTDPKSLTSSIILWGQGTDPKINPVVGGNIILWGQGTDPKINPGVGGDIILWGQGTDPKKAGTGVSGDIILWGQGTDPKANVPITGEP
ncbi:MAG: S8 family peptidase [Capsulimonadales bacterium]|nr:S8 family peptidase [Capsulimonadales bacterium]